jgi:hypothetical protein
VFKGFFVGRALGLYGRLVAGTRKRMSLGALAIRGMRREVLGGKREALWASLLEPWVRIMRTRCRRRMGAAGHGSWQHGHGRPGARGRWAEGTLRVWRILRHHRWRKPWRKGHVVLVIVSRRRALVMIMRWWVSVGRLERVVRLARVHHASRACASGRCRAATWHLLVPMPGRRSPQR